MATICALVSAMLFVETRKKFVRSKGSPKYSEMWVAKGKHNTSQCGKWLQQLVEFKLLVKKAPKRGLSGQVRNAWSSQTCAAAQMLLAW